jgi:glycosyltransferase involved in cell wall biosynthesis
MPELLQDGLTGFVVDDVDAAVGAVHGLARLDRRACRGDAERRFSASRMVADYERLFVRIVGGSA